MRPQTPADTTVLVVDDDQNVRDIAVTALEMAGFNVLEANNASTALQLFIGNPNIHLIVSDVIMPGRLSGVDMVKEILQKRSTAKIILVTGYKDKAKALKQGLTRSGSVHLLTKPYDVDQLTDLVKTILFNQGDPQ